MARRGLNSKKNGIAGVLLGLSLALTSAYAQGGRVTQIEVDSQQNLVFAVQGLEAPPNQPKFMPLENPAQLLIELSGLDLDRQNLPSAEELSEKLSQSIPNLKSIKYLMAVGPDGKPTNTCRFLLEFAEGSALKPTLARLNENLVAVHFGGAVTASAPAASAQPAARSATANAAPANSGDMQSAYEQYYRAFMAQKSQSQSLSSDWQQRKGSISELGTNKNVKPVVTDTALDIAAAAAKAVVPAEEKVAAADTRKEEPGWDWSQEKSGDTPKLDIKPIPVNSPQPTVAAVQDAPTAPQQVAQVVPEAQPVVKQAAAEAPVTPAAVEQDPVQAPEQAAQAGRTDEAPANTPEGEEAVAVNPLDAIMAGADSPKLKARKLFNQAVDDHLHGRLDKAIVGYKAAISVNPELATAHSNLGLAYNQKNNYASAIGEFHKALALNPKDAITYNGIGAALKAEKDLAGAVANFETAVKHDPKLAVAHYNLGTAYEALGEFDKAINSYESALRADAHMGEAHYRVGLILQKRKRFAEAKERFQSALKIDASSGYSADARQRLSLLGGAKSIR